MSSTHFHWWFTVSLCIVIPLFLAATMFNACSRGPPPVSSDIEYIFSRLIVCSIRRCLSSKCPRIFILLVTSVAYRVHVANKYLQIRNLFFLISFCFFNRVIPEQNFIINRTWMHSWKIQKYKTIYTKICEARERFLLLLFNLYFRICPGHLVNFSNLVAK